LEWNDEGFKWWGVRQHDSPQKSPPKDNHHVQPDNVDTWMKNNNLELRNIGFSKEQIHEIYRLYSNNVDGLKDLMKTYGELEDKSMQWEEYIKNHKIQFMHHEAEYIKYKHSIELELRNAVKTLNEVIFIGHQIETDHTFLPQRFHRKYPQHIQNVHSLHHHHGSQSSHASQGKGNEETKSLNTTTKTANTHNEDNDIWTKILNPRLWFQTPTTSKNFNAIDARGLYISAY